MLTLTAALLEEAEAVQSRRVFGDVLSLEDNGVDLPDDALVPGLVVFTRRAPAVAGESAKPLYNCFPELLPFITTQLEIDLRAVPHVLWLFDAVLQRPALHGPCSKLLVYSEGRGLFTKSLLKHNSFCRSAYGLSGVGIIGSRPTARLRHSKCWGVTEVEVRDI